MPDSNEKKREREKERKKARGKERKHACSAMECAMITLLARSIALMRSRAHLFVPKLMGKNWMRQFWRFNLLRERNDVLFSCYSFFSFQKLFSGPLHFSFFFLQVYGRFWDNRDGALTEGPILPARWGSLVGVIPNLIDATHRKIETIIIYARKCFSFRLSIRRIHQSVP